MPGRFNFGFILNERDIFTNYIIQNLPASDARSSTGSLAFFVARMKSVLCRVFERVVIRMSELSRIFHLPQTDCTIDKLNVRTDPSPQIFAIVMGDGLSKIQIPTREWLNMTNIWILKFRIFRRLVPTHVNTLSKKSLLSGQILIRRRL